MRTATLSKQCPVLRSDLEWIRYSDQDCWVVRDPLTSDFFQLSEREHAVARLLNGRRNGEELLEEVRNLLPSQKDVAAWLNVFLLKLFHSQLLVPGPSNSLPGGRLFDRRERKSSWLAWVFNPLSIRIPILRPSSTTLLARLLAHVLFHPLFVILSLTLALVSSLLVLGRVIGRPEEAFQDLQLIQGDRWLILVGMYVVIKSLHESGHYLACVKWKSRVREIGLLFLFFTPCMYCDITDSWRIPSRWRRAAIAAAGIYVEILIAGVAAWIWLISDRGLERTLAASVLGMCSVGTILVNGNPFFKYDGYYILSDLWKVPNLSQQAASALWGYFVWILGGKAPSAGDFNGDMRLLALFAIGSMIYRCFVLVILLWIAWNLFVPAGFGFLVLLIFATTALGLLLMARKFMEHFMSEFYAPKPIRVFRVIALMALAVFFILGALIVPLPSSIRSRATLDFADKVPIYATQTAIVKYVADTCIPVQMGQTILILDAPEKRIELLKTQHEIDELTSKRNLLKKSTVNDPSAVFEIPTIDALIRELEAKKGILVLETESLRIVAPFDGTVIKSSLQVNPNLVPPLDLRNLGRPLDVESTGCTVERGTLLGWFTQGSEPLFEAFVAESDVKRLKIGDVALCRLDASPSRVIRCQVQRISPDPIDSIPNLLIGDSMLIAIRDASGAIRPDVPHYRVTLKTNEKLPMRFTAIWPW